jgi:hypothetical protein
LPGRMEGKGHHVANINWHRSEARICGPADRVGNSWHNIGPNALKQLWADSQRPNTST